MFFEVSKTPTNDIEVAFISSKGALEENITVLLATLYKVFPFATQNMLGAKNNKINRYFKKDIDKTIKHLYIN